MDVEDRLDRVESDVRRMKVHVLTLLAVILLLLLLVLPRVSGSGDWVVSILVVLALAALAHLLVSAGRGLRLFWTRRAADVQLQEKIMREFIAERGKR